MPVSFTNRFIPIGFDKSALLHSMKKEHLDAILLTSPEDVFYTTGYASLPSSGNPILYTLRNRLPPFSLISANGKVILICWGYSSQGVEFGVDEVVGFNSFGEAGKALVAVIGREVHFSGRIGITSSCPHYVLEILNTSDLAHRLMRADAVIEELRLIKSREEIARLRKSLEITEVTCLELFELLQIGMGRSQLAVQARYRLMKHGANGVSHVTLSFGGANPELDIDEPLEMDRLVVMDIGGIYDGYCSDTRRYAHTGPIPPLLAHRYEQMVDIVDRVGEALIPGRHFDDLFRFALEEYAEHQITPPARFNHIGHNIGLETEERWVDDNPSHMVKPGMVINIELYSILETGEQIGNEETYVINSSGPSRISQLPRTIKLIS